MSIIRAAAAAIFGLALSAAPTLAHPKLLASTPAAGATVAPTNRLELRFSEDLEARFTGAEITTTRIVMDGRMMAHVMKIGGVTAAIDPAHGRTLVLTLKAPLAPGAYKVAWRAVSTDTHRLTGNYAFSVK